MVQIAGLFLNIIFSKKYFMNWNHFLKIQIRKTIIETVVKRTDLDFVHHTRSDVNTPLHGLKVSQFQKQNLLFSFKPKNERNYYLISALASKNRSDKKRHFTLLIRGYLT